MLYFAYGSNMDSRQMRRRCPSSRFLCRALLPGHRVDFPRRSPRRRCGVAGIVPDPSRGVWGVVYRIAAARDIATLDRAEGFKWGRKRANGYTRGWRTVYADGKSDRPLAVETYIAVPSRFVPPPNEAYIDHMLRGASHWKLPPAYTSWLRSLRDEITR